MKMLSPWWAWQGGWRGLAQMVALLAAMGMSVLVGGVVGVGAKEVSARIEVSILDNGMVKPARPELPVSPILSD